MLLLSLWGGTDLGRGECLQSTCLIMPPAVALRPEQRRGALWGRVHAELPPSRAGTHGSYNPTVLCEKQDVTLPASMRSWVCRPGVPASTADRAGGHNPPQQLLNQPAIREGQDCLKSCQPAAFLHIWGMFTVTVLLHKGSPGNEGGQDGCKAQTQNLPRFLGWDAERLSKA